MLNHELAVDDIEFRTVVGKKKFVGAHTLRRMFEKHQPKKKISLKIFRSTLSTKQ